MGLLPSKQVPALDAKSTPNRSEGGLGREGDRWGLAVGRRHPVVSSASDGPACAPPHSFTQSLLNFLCAKNIPEAREGKDLLGVPLPGQSIPGRWLSARCPRMQHACQQLGSKLSPQSARRPHRKEVQEKAPENPLSTCGRHLGALMLPPPGPGPELAPLAARSTFSTVSGPHQPSTSNGERWSKDPQGLGQIKVSASSRV